MIGPLVYVACFLAVTHGAYLNDYDGLLNFQCTSDLQTIGRIQSVHDNGPEDRRFDLSCRDFLDPGQRDGISAAQCYWTDYQNTFDELLAFSCPTNHYVTGMNSVHDNGSEDRKWKFRCCSVAEIHMSDCSFSGWTNSYDGVQDYTLPANTVLKGAISEHDNGAEDRRYEYEYCGVYRKETVESVVGK